VGERDLPGGEERVGGKRFQQPMASDRGSPSLQSGICGIAPKSLTRIMWQQIESLGDARSLVFPQLCHVGRSSFN
jgi:hypothetical protein